MTPWRARWDDHRIETYRLEEVTALGAWSAVSSIWAFKRDMLTTDNVCMAIKADCGWLEINEESTDRWEELIERLPTLVQGARAASDWWPEAAHPPFETCLTQIYGTERPWADAAAGPR
jgi:hypothetical protein